MAEAQHKADMDSKMKVMIREIIFYSILLFLLLVVINGQQDTNSYLQNENIIVTFQRRLDNDVSTCFSSLQWPRGWRSGYSVGPANLKVAGSNLGRSAFRQQPWASCSHTHVPLSRSSIIWYRSKGGDVLRLGR